METPEPDHPKGPSIKYVRLFLANFDPPALSHTLSHIPGAPKKVRHTSRTPRPIFSRPSTKNPDKSPCTNSLSIMFARAFVWKVLSGVVFVRTPFCQNTSVTTES